MYSSPATVSVTVLSINEAPYLVEIGNRQTLEDNPLTILLEYGDVVERHLLDEDIIWSSFKNKFGNIQCTFNCAL